MFTRWLEAFYRWGARVLAHAIYRLRCVHFDQHIPTIGPAIIIANHISFMDGLMIHTAIKNRRVYYVIDKDIYHSPFVKYFMDINGAIPIEPTRSSVQRAFEKVRDVLRQGHLVCIFPEGSLSPTGNLGRFRFGIEHIARDNKVDVIPVAISGLWGSIFSRKHLGKKTRWLPRDLFRKVVLVCGAPIAWQQVSVSHLQREIMKLKNEAQNICKGCKR